MYTLPPKKVNNHEKFKVSIDYPSIYKKIKLLRKEYTESKYIHIGSNISISEKEFLEDIDRMQNDITNIKNDPDFIKGLIERMPKKRDGTFCKRRVILCSEYINTAMRINNSTIRKYYSIRMKTISDTDAVICIGVEYVD
jgi:hypothetical protein